MSQLSPRKRQKLITAMSKGMTQYEIANLMGVSTRTIKRWRADDPELKDLMDEARELADDRVEAKVFAMCENNDDPANNTLRIFWLKNRRPDEFRQESATVVHGDVHKH